MAIHELRGVGVTADLTVEVPRNGRGDLQSGVETQLHRVAGVATVDDVDVTGITPRLNDLTADATVRVTVDVDRPDADAVTTVLGDGFGITVRDVRLDDPPP